MLFDAAHLCGMIAGGAWPNPLAEGAHLMTMSTYKSLGGPPGGLVVTDDAELAQRLDAIAYPGLTANFDAGKTAALAMTMLDWKVAGPAYARAMIDTASALAAALPRLGRARVRRRPRRPRRRTSSRCSPARYGGGQRAAAAAAAGEPAGLRHRPAGRAGRR